MHTTGFRWVLRPDGDQWAWKALDRDTGEIRHEGQARTRAEGAAHLARVMALGVVQDQLHAR